MKKPETPQTLVASVTAFIFNIIVIVAFTMNYNNDNTFPQSAVYTTVVVLLLVFLLAPVISRVKSYNAFFNPPRGFSISAVIHEYDLRGWIKGKYIFLDAVLSRVNGDTAKAAQLYEVCIRQASDKRLRLACYTEIARFYGHSIDLIPHIVDASKEFPENQLFVSTVSRYFVWCPTADPNEGERWFNEVIEKNNNPVSVSAAYIFLGCRKMYNGEYKEALDLFLKAEEVNNLPPAYLLLDIAVCYACLKDFDKSREYAVLAAAIVDDKQEVDYIKEKMDYIFRAELNEINPETKKLVQELARRDRERETETLDKYREIMEVRK